MAFGSLSPWHSQDIPATPAQQGAMHGIPTYWRHRNFVLGSKRMEGVQTGNVAKPIEGLAAPVGLTTLPILRTVA